MSQRTVKMFPVKGNLWPISSKADRGALPVPDQACPELERALRTTFTTVDGQPIQVIAATLTMKLPIVQLGELSEAEREGEVRRLATEEAQKPFDLSQGPLLRINLLRLAKEEHVLLLTIHHMVSDAWSMGVFFRELSGLYQSFSTGKSSPLPEPSIQYAGFAIWQRQCLEEDVFEKQLSFWRQQLAGIAKRFFAPGEVAVFCELEAHEKQEAFFNCWTRKEAFIKATGQGVSFGLDNFAVSLMPGEPAALLNVAGDAEKARRWSLKK